MTDSVHPIEVRLRIDDAPKHLTQETWSEWVFNSLIDAGIPADEKGFVMSGTLIRREDPEDFAVTIYRWIP